MPNPTTDSRPGGWNHVFRPGQAFTIEATWPAGVLAGLDLAATLGGVALDLSVAGDVLTVDASAVVTTAAGLGSSTFVLTDGGDPVLIGTWRGSNSAASQPVSDVVVVDLDPEAVEVTVTVAGGGGGGGAVDSVNGETGVVVLTAGEVGADPAGTATAAVAAHSADTTAVHGIADTADLVDTADLTSGLAAKQSTSEKGQANGYASLDGTAKVPSNQLPALALTDVYTVADITARDALTVEEGDVAIVNDAGSGQPKSYIYDGTTWQELRSPTDAVSSVDGRTGAVSLSDLYQPVDADLTAIAALTTTAFGRSVLEAANAAALRTLADAQPADADLTAIAALTTTAYGRALLETANLAALQAILGSGSPSGSTFLRGDGTWAAPTSGSVCVVKSADETVTGSTTLQNDDELLFAVAAGESWAFELELFADQASSPSSDITVALTVPTGCSVLAQVVGTQVTESAAFGTAAMRALGNITTSGGTVSAGCHPSFAGFHYPLTIRGSVRNGANAGNVQLQWAQASATSSTTVRAGSTLRAMKDV